MKHHTFISMLFLFSLPSIAIAEQSVLTVPLSMPMAALQHHANAAIPKTLHQENRSQRCAEPEKACTKVPEFRGLKMTMRNRCVEVTPAIDCSIDSRVWREGPMAITGENNALVLRQHIRASATVRGRGDLGRHLRQTVDGAAQFEVRAHPVVRPDWTIDLDSLALNYTWTERPNVTLFGMVPVTFGSEAENELNAQISRFRSQDLPRLLSGVGLKSRMESIWSQLQEPQKIELDENNALHAHFRPEKIALAPIIVTNQATSTTASIAGRFQVTDTPQSPFESVSALPELSSATGEPVIAMTVPIEFEAATLTALLNNNLPLSDDFDQPVTGSIEISTGSVRIDGKRLVADLDIAADLNGMPDYTGPIRMSTVPELDAEAEEIRFTELELTLENGGASSTVLNFMINQMGLLSFLAGKAVLPLRPELDKMQDQMNQALNRDLANGARLEVNIALSVQDLAVDGKLTLVAVATGSARIAVTF